MTVAALMRPSTIASDSSSTPVPKNAGVPDCDPINVIGASGSPRPTRVPQTPTVRSGFTDTTTPGQTSTLLSRPIHIPDHTTYPPPPDRPPHPLTLPPPPL